MSRRLTVVDKREIRRMAVPEPPVAPRRAHTHERFGVTWNDDWAWLRDPAYPEVVDPEIRTYLEAENSYYASVMAPHAALIARLYDELKARLKPDDHSVPVRDGRWDYSWRFEPGAQYRSWWRSPAAGGEAVLILDENALARDRSYLLLRMLRANDDGDLLAYTLDEDGSERFWLVVKDLTSGSEIEHRVSNTSGSFAWAADGRSLLYVELNEQLRPFRVRLHRLGAAPATDAIVFEETDPAFFVSLGRTRDGQLVQISSGTHVTREVHLVPAAAPSTPPRCVSPRREGHRYTVDHAHGRLYIVTNDRHENFRLVEVPTTDPGEAGWRELLAGDDHRYLLSVDCFAGFMVIRDRLDGLAELRVRHYEGQEHRIAFEETIYTAAVGDNRCFVTDRVRLSYQSMVTPASVIDYVVDQRALVVRKVQEVPSGYDKQRYRSERLLAPAADGTMVPVSLVYRDDYPIDGRRRLFLYGYGAYGHGLEPSFNVHRLSLLDRGFCFAYAHVRGGDELGWRWYEAGRLAQKENSFGDFIAVAEHLVRVGQVVAGDIAIRGGSAGGMLVGTVANRRPELWRCAIADVPFVDVLNTMSDPSLPLTPIEWPEWGNPIADAAAFARIMAYSPYDNIRAQDYPPMLVTAGIADPRVTYWEPAKLVARLRATKTDRAPLLFKVNMTAGHFGKSGRFESLHELAEQYCFLLDCFGLIERQDQPQPAASATTSP